MEFRAVSGTWSLESDGSRKGIVDASLTARAVRGSETDEDYKFQADVDVSAGKASLIVNYTVDVDWKENYLAFTLDPTLLSVYLESVQRDDLGAEISRTTLALRAFSIAIGRHRLKVLTRTLSDGSKAVYCFIDGFLVCEAEGLAENTLGMQGFECLGADTDYSTFSKIIYSESQLAGYSSVEDVKAVLILTDTDHDADLESCIITADAWVDNQFSQANLTVPSSTPELVVQASAHYAAFLFKDRGTNSLKDKQLYESMFRDKAAGFLGKYISANAEIAFRTGEAV